MTYNVHYIGSAGNLLVDGVEADHFIETTAMVKFLLEGDPVAAYKTDRIVKIEKKED